MEVTIQEILELYFQGYYFNDILEVITSSKENTVLCQAREV
ncbi:hypothetical protein [uncultured Tissierella sp.]|nr:hypothetical protein [uncultured Tissierella sp.]MDU5080266.1 hypothetical protein [Bacillota bacterium]